MRLNILKILFLATIVLYTSACSEEDLLPIDISAQEFTATIAENPEDSYIIGEVSASTSRGVLMYKVMAQEPANAIAINEFTGEISVDDISAFDFEERLFITAMIEITNEDVKKVISAKVNITDVDE